MVERRLWRLFKALDAKDIDVYLAAHTADIRWLTGFAGVFDEEQAHLALIVPGARAVSDMRDVGGEYEATFVALHLFTDTRYSAALRQLDAENRWKIHDERRPRFSYVAETLATESLIDSLKAARKGKDAAPLRIGIESDLRLDSYRALCQALEERNDLNFELVELSHLVSELRSIKDAHEIEALKAAQSITDRAFIHMLDYLKPGLTEREAASELEFFMRRAGADGVAFASIVAGGPNSAIPHAIPGGRVFERGDFVLMDFGARLNDYRSDMTRTVALGRASEQQKAMYAAVLAAQTAVIETLAPNMSGLEAQNIADTVIAEHGFEGKFIHSLGHGVGIDIHELPVLAPKVKTRLEVGQVVTVEPGVYIDGVGGVRIEDYGVVTEHGFEDFTQSPKELLIV
ncbi:MAG: aminopeptidase P family protein [Coriobacteriales bacterium]|jgi:Xaa-Pro aminopeptidase|nr:aminopeptidase P family protein [Coriobacteriales bacterium]